MHTVRFKNELERNITIKLGYANAKIYQCKDPECPRPGNFTTRGSSTEDVVKMGKWSYELVRHVSFVDCPGHDILMATMLNGASPRSRFPLPRTMRGSTGRSCGSREPSAWPRTPPRSTRLLAAAAAVIHTEGGRHSADASRACTAATAQAPP